MSKVKFDLKPVDEKPSRRYRKGSKYDPILDAFMYGREVLATVDVAGKDANYLRIQLNKRIEGQETEGSRGLSSQQCLLLGEGVNTGLDALHPTSGTLPRASKHSTLFSHHLPNGTRRSREPRSGLTESSIAVGRGKLEIQRSWYHNDPDIPRDAAIYKCRKTDWGTKNDLVKRK